MRLHSAICYRSGGEEWDDPWEDRHYRARNLVKALKCKPFNGYSDFRGTDGKYYRVQDSPAGQEVALLIAGTWIGKMMEEAGYEHAVVVPIPASDHVAAGGDFTGGRLAAKIMELRPGLVAAPALHFATAMAASSAGGGRNSQVVQANLRGGEALLDRGPIVLLDDVYTTGAHIRGAARYLASLGIQVEDSFVLARTVWQEPANMFQCPVEEIDGC